MALVQVAPSPGTLCINTLEKTIEVQRHKIVLDNLTSDTRIVMQYFKQ